MNIASGHEMRAPRPCPGCHEESSELLHTQRFVLPDGHPLHAGYRVMICDKCDIGYASPLPPQSEFDRYYAELSKYASVSVTSGSGVQSWDQSRLEKLARRVFTISGEPEGASIVDIGCGAGGSLPNFARAGFGSVIGVDPSASCVMAGRLLLARHGIQGEIVEGTFDSLPTVASGADVYVLSHVVEHVRDVRAALLRIKSAAKASSVLYVEVPDATRFVDYPASPLLEFNTEHINYLGTESLSHLLQTCGWETIGSGRDEIPNGPHTMYPISWAAARPANDSKATSAASSTLRENLLAYISNDLAKLEALNTRVAHHPLLQGPLAVWGTGQTTAILLANSSIGSGDIRAFIDSDSRFEGRRIGNAPVVPLDFVRTRPDWTVFVSSVLSDSSIRETIRSSGLANAVVGLSELLT